MCWNKILSFQRWRWCEQDMVKMRGGTMVADVIIPTIPGDNCHLLIGSSVIGSGRGCASGRGGVPVEGVCQWEGCVPGGVCASGRSELLAALATSSANCVL